MSEDCLRRQQGGGTISGVAKLRGFPQGCSDPEEDHCCSQKCGHPDQAEAKLKLPPRDERRGRQDQELQRKAEVMLDSHGGLAGAKMLIDPITLWRMFDGVSPHPAAQCPSSLQRRS